jgi:predicted transcriptional regulator
MSSRIEGNQRDPTEEELAIMDEMITKLADAKPYDLPNAVRRAFRVCSSPQFFMRIAARADEATNDEKEKLSALASNLVATLDAVVSTTEDQLDERAKEVQNVVTAAAEPDGEFLVPLSAERIQSMQDEVAKLDPAIIDEGFLSTVDAWMNKSHQDGLDGMVGKKYNGLGR